MFYCSQLDSITRATAIKDELLNLTRGGYCVQDHKDSDNKKNPLQANKRGKKEMASSKVTLLQLKHLRSFLSRAKISVETNRALT